MVKKAFLGGALILTKMDENDLHYLVNTDAVKMYYAEPEKSGELSKAKTRKGSLDR